MVKKKTIKFDKVIVSKSDRDKKFKAVFTGSDGKVTRKKTIHFGAKGMSDYTIHKDDERKKRYLARHNPSVTKENWSVPDTAASLSRWILWNKKSYNESLKDYKKRFKLK